MSRPLTIVMYHYVRDAEQTPYPGIRALGVGQFKGQIGYIRKHYNVIGGDDLLAALIQDRPLPPNALLLTFDDGYVDHLDHVLPVLERHGLPACFFPIAECVKEHKVSDVNKIQFILSQAPDTRTLIEFLSNRVDNFETYRARIRTEKYFDDPDVVLVKELLQRLLPAEERKACADELFRTFVSDDETAFSKSLYMQSGDLKTLRDRGMYVGSHTYTHQWLGELPPEEQEKEIDRSVDFLRDIGVPADAWIMCYPKGSYSDHAVVLLEARGCKAGLTTDVDLVDLSTHHPLKLPRIDTIDLPFKEDAAMNEWTRKANEFDR